MKIINPHNEKLRIQHKGTIYECPANGSRSNTPSDTAEFWKTHVHQFITVEDEVVVTTPSPVAVISETETVEETPTEEVVEEVSITKAIEEIATEAKTKKSVTKSKTK